MGDAGAVDQDIEASAGLGEGGGYTVRLGNVATDADGGGTGLTGDGLCGFRCLLGIEIEHEYGGALGGEEFGDGEPYTAGRSGDQNVFSLELEQMWTPLNEVVTTALSFTFPIAGLSNMKYKYHQ